MPTRVFAKPTKGDDKALQQPRKPISHSQNQSQSQASTIAVSAPILTPISDVKIHMHLEGPTLKSVGGFQELVASKREERIKRKEAKAARGRGQTIDDKLVFSQESSSVASLDDEDEFSSLNGSIGIGRYTKKLTEKRKSVFKRDPPKILQVFTYVNHEQLLEQVVPVAYDNFVSTQSERSWKELSSEFFVNGRIGASKDDTTLFVDPEDGLEEEFRQKLAKMSSKERRMAYRSSNKFEPPPIVPTFTRDASFLYHPRLENKKHHGSFVPSIFVPHPYEHFVVNRKLREKDGVNVEGKLALDLTIAAPDTNTADLEIQNLGEPSTPCSPVAVTEMTKQQERENKLSKIRASAIAEWTEMHNPTKFFKQLSHLNSVQRSMGDDASVDTFTMIYGTKDEQDGYKIHETELDEALYFGEAAKLRFYGKYHQLCADVLTTSNEIGTAQHQHQLQQQQHQQSEGSIQPLQQYHLDLSPRTRFITRFIETFRKMPLPIIIRPRSDEHDLAVETELNLANMSLGDEYIILLAETLTELPRLESLNLSGNNLTDKSMALVVQILADVPTVTELDLSCNKVDSQTARYLANALKLSDSAIQTLRLSSADFDDSEVALFMQCFAKNKSIKILDFSRNRVGGGRAEYQSQSGSSREGTKNKKVPTLPTAPNSEEKLSGCEAIATALANTQTLETLKLNWNSIGPCSAIHLSRGVAETTSLRELHLAFNGTKDAGAEAIGSALMSNRSITLVDLSGNQITFEGSFLLSCALQKNASLCILDLSSNPIGCRGARTLMRAINYPCDEAIKENGQDRNVILSKCSLGDEAATTTSTTFDLVYSSGEHIFDLSIGYDRCLALELLKQAALRRGCSFKRISFTQASDRPSTKTKSTVINLATPTPMKRSELQGNAYVPWRLSDPPGRHPYTQLSAHDWARLVDGLALIDSKTGLPWVVPASGTLVVDFCYEPRATSPIELLNASGMSRLLRLIDSSSNDMRLSDIWSMCQDLKMESHQLELLLAKIPGRKRRFEQVEMLAKLLPCVVDVANVEPTLKGHFGNDFSAFAEIRQLMHTHLYYICFNAPTGHYKLDLSHPFDRLAGVRLCEIDNEENDFFSRAMPAWNSYPAHGFTSQYKNRSNFRNEIMSGKARTNTGNNVPHGVTMETLPAASSVDESDPSANSTSRDRPHQALNTPGYYSRGLANLAPGTIEFDFVSTSRPLESARALNDSEFVNLLVSRGLTSGAVAVADALLRVPISPVPFVVLESGCRWLHHDTPAPEVRALFGTGTKETNDICSDRAVCFVGPLGVNHLFVFRAVVRVHSGDLPLLSFKSINARARSETGTTKNERKNVVASRKSAKSKSKKVIQSGFPTNVKGVSKSKKELNKSGESNAKDIIVANDNCAGPSTGAEEEEEEEVEVEEEVEEEDNDDDSSSDANGQLSFDEVESDPKGSSPRLQSPRALSQSPRQQSFLKHQQSVSSIQSSSRGSASARGSVLEACLCFYKSKDTEGRATAKHCGVGVSSSSVIYGQSVNVLCPWLDKDAYTLSSTHEENLLPTHSRFLVKEGPAALVVSGSEINIEVPASQNGDLSFIQSQLLMLFSAFSSSAGDVDSNTLLDFIWTHDSTIELDTDNVFGFAAGSNAVLHVITRRLDCVIKCVPHVPQALFKTLFSGMEIVWRWRDIRSDDRDAQTLYVDSEATWELPPIATSNTELLAMELPRCWIQRMATFRHSFGHVWLTCKQAARLVKSWPQSLRQDMAIYLFSRLIDLENFNDVIDAVCENHPDGLVESTFIYRRLGFINAINLML